MANKLVTVLKDVSSVALWPLNHLEKVIAAINATMKAEPAVKAAIVGLLAKIQALAADATAAATADGLCISADEATAAAAATLFTYVKDVFVPAMEAAFKLEKGAIANTPALSPPAPAAPAPVSS
jgi:hypothetical protein